MQVFECSVSLLHYVAYSVISNSAVLKLSSQSRITPIPSTLLAFFIGAIPISADEYGDLFCPQSTQTPLKLPHLSLPALSQGPDGAARRGTNEAPGAAPLASPPGQGFTSRPRGGGGSSPLRPKRPLAEAHDSLSLPAFHREPLLPNEHCWPRDPLSLFQRDR